MATKFKLPREWYRFTIERLVRNDLPPLLGPLTAQSAWRYVYAIVMWSHIVDDRAYLHLAESNTLQNRAGRRFADEGADYLAQHLGTSSCNPFEMIDHVGRAYALERKTQGFGPPDRRDPNVTGAAFETVLQVLIGDLCGVVPSRTPDLRTLRGFELAPVGYHSRPDLVLFNPADFRLLISTKWTLRKERIGTYLHEAYYYKRRRPDLQVAFVVSEFSQSILQWLSRDPLADRVYHVNLDMLLKLHEPFRSGPHARDVPRSVLLGQSKAVDEYRRWLDLSERIFDLNDLFRDIAILRDGQRPVLDPDTDEADSDLL